MKAFMIILIALAATATGSPSEEETKEFYFQDKMLPLAREFIKRNNMALAAEFTTNEVALWKFDLYDDGRRGGQGWIRLKTGHSFSFFIGNNGAELWEFVDGSVKTYYDLTFAPNEKVDAVKALLTRNKLNNQAALELARKYFRLQGHKEENFHPVEFFQLYWIKQDDEPEGGGLLPYYRATWYRKDANLDDRGTLHPTVRIEVSGITSNLISYSKLFMPIGSDF